MPSQRVIRVAIVGGGISGITQAVRLKEVLGDKVELTIFERATEPGGVWRDSTWPGAGVDVSIHLYQLYSELNPNWSSKFAGRDEVLAYWNGIIDKHNLRSRFVFSASFSSSTWDATSQYHTLVFDRPSPSPQLVFEADVFVSAAGALNTPIIPTLEGIESFEGQQWHSSRWRNDVDLRNKKVAVVGNGSSGIQVVPNLVGIEGIEVTQFIRSPGYFTPKVNHQYSRLTKFAFNWVPGLQRVYRWYLFYQLDYSSLAKGTGKWTNELRAIHTQRLLTYLRAHTPEKYLDALTPKYPLHCKRVAYDAGWLASLHEPNVSLVSTAITAVTPKGLLTADGVSHEFDVIVWATGFDVSRTGVGLNHGVHGEDGVELRAEWEKKEGAEAYLAVAIPKFPNYFIVLGPNAISMSWGYTLGNQTELISRLVKGLLDYKVSSISPKEEVNKAYNIQMQKRLHQTVLVSPTCNAWYRYKGTGKVIAPSGLCATELYIRTRQIKWEDWEAHRVLEKGGKAQIVELKSPIVLSPFELVFGSLMKRLEHYLLIHTTE